MSQPQPHTACPYPHGADERKSAALAAASPARAERLEGGGMRIETFAETRKVLRSGVTRQAGFMAELVRGATKEVPPVLYQEGEVHQKQRAATARFFAPRVVTGRYREMMQALSEKLMGRLETDKRGDLADMSLEMAVAVAAEIIGLTNSSIAGMSRRLDRFFTQGAGRKGPFKQLRDRLSGPFGLLAFYWMDVKPAIRARKRRPQEDLISHLLQQGYTNAQILTECMTYGAAGMATTREFIVMAAWHMMERPELRDRFMTADEAGRNALLEEILRLEPVVGALYRRTQAELVIEGADGQSRTIPAGTLLDLDVRAANGDPTVVGQCPHQIIPDRAQREGSAIGTMSFGDGNHRCPGAAVALQESAIFLERLFRIPGLTMVKPPTQKWNTLTVGYELRDALIAVG